MLERLGFKRFAYDYRAEHIPHVRRRDRGAEEARHRARRPGGFPPTLNDEARQHPRRAQAARREAAALGHRRRRPAKTDEEQRQRVEQRGGAPPPHRRGGGELGLQGRRSTTTAAGSASRRIRSRSSRRLQSDGITNVGIVYNLHHGHDHLDRLPGAAREDEAAPAGAEPQRHDPRRRRSGKKILPLGQGDLDLTLLRTHARQRLARTDRHPRTTRTTTPKPASSTTSTASTGW